MLEGDIWEASSSGSRGRATQSQDIGPQGCYPLHTEFRLNQIKVRSYHQHH